MFERFKSYKLNIENISKSSLEQYEKILTGFLAFYGKTIDDEDFIINLKATEIKNYIEHLSILGKEPSTRNKVLAVIKSFYKYLYNEENIEVDTRIFFVKKAKKAYKEPLWLQDDEMEKFLEVIKCPRTKSMVEMLYYTGMRFSEIINITIEDFLNGKAVITGKGNKQRTIYFGNSELVECVSNYILTKRQDIIKRTGKDTDLLFINNNGNKMLASNFIGTLKKYAKCVEGLNRYKEMSPHKLRHSFITNALLNGESISVVRDAVGHSNISTTNNYAHSTRKSVENLMNGKKEQNKEMEREEILDYEREMFGFI